VSFISQIIGDTNQRYLNKIRPLMEKVNELEPEYEQLSDLLLKSKTEEFRERLAKGENLDDLLPEAFAAVREASKRAIGLRHFDVQILGGIVLHQGKIAEMKTGEGKTLAATLAVYLNALEGRGVHVVTVNDYLSKRDTNWMGAVYHALGMGVGCIVHDRAYLYEPQTASDKDEVTVEMENLKEVLRKAAYEADITYGTNNEFGFDYLRDNMVQDLLQMAQRSHHYAIVDECDSILIDEARTPLIISAPDVESTKLYETFAKVIPRLSENIDYNIDEKMKAATLTDEGIEKVEKILGIDIYGEGTVRYAHQLEQALRANVLFKKDKDYVVKDGEIIIVDDFTGRLMFGRRYSGGLHQAIEAKEGVKVQQESKTLATITFQNYFRMYKKLAGMTGTAYTNAEEFNKVYKLDVVQVPTNKPMVRNDMQDKIYQTGNGKFMAVAREIKERHEKGQPVLVGTVSIEKNELLSALLKKEGIPHEILNAKNHEKEAQIIANAGKRGAVTVATNMAGRGVDIILGGRAQLALSPAELGGGRAEDDKTKRRVASDLNPPTHQVVGDPPFRKKSTSTGHPEQSEGSHWQTEHNKVVGLGGLHVIGTERHEARRIDNQLRGRSGRQGDPGSSQFFVSLEDDLMRIFGSDKIKRMMQAFDLPEDQPIENRMVSKAIESAQAKIEGYNFDIRKHVLEYDDVMNKQRETIYRKRKEVLESLPAARQAVSDLNPSIPQVVDRLPTANDISDDTSAVTSPLQKETGEKIFSLKAQILEAVRGEIGKIVNFHAAENYHDNWNLEEIGEIMNAIFGLTSEEKNKVREFKNKEKLTQYLNELAKQKYQEKEKQIGEENMRQVEKAIMLRIIDVLWIEHLDNMDHLRDSVRLRAYGQRDPLVEYKNEGHRLFSQLLQNINGQAVNLIYKVEISRNNAELYAEQRGTPALVGETNAEKFSMKGSLQNKNIGRNDPCPCGSGKKYKKCCGK
jgi:preprotein translocase subunit SecA